MQNVNSSSYNIYFILFHIFFWQFIVFCSMCEADYATGKKEWLVPCCCGRLTT